jgi:hypothetical protein
VFYVSSCQQFLGGLGLQRLFYGRVADVQRKKKSVFKPRQAV